MLDLGKKLELHRYPDKEQKESKEEKGKKKKSAYTLRHTVNPHHLESSVPKMRWCNLGWPPGTMSLPFPSSPPHCSPPSHGCPSVILPSTWPLCPFIWEPTAIPDVHVVVTETRFLPKQMWYAAREGGSTMWFDLCHPLGWEYPWPGIFHFPQARFLNSFRNSWIVLMASIYWALIPDRHWAK